MTEPIPVRVTELQEVVEGGRTVRSARIVEYAAHEPPRTPAVALPCGEHPYSPECCSPMARSGMVLDEATDGPRGALPPAPPAPARRWWGRRL